MTAASSSRFLSRLASACLGPSVDGPAAVRRTVRACQERETVAGWALTGSKLADVGLLVLRVDKSRSRVLARALWEEMMKALVYHGPGLKTLEDRPKPEIKAPSDAIVKVVKTTICGTDLHILKGDVPTCTPGRILGHEGVGIVDAVGAGVTAFKTGDHV